MRSWEGPEHEGVRVPSLDLIQVKEIEPQKGLRGRTPYQVAILSFRKVELLRQDQRQEGQEKAGWQSRRKKWHLYWGPHGSEK